MGKIIRGHLFHHAKSWGKRKVFPTIPYLIGMTSSHITTNQSHDWTSLGESFCCTKLYTKLGCRIKKTSRNTINNIRLSWWQNYHLEDLESSEEHPSIINLLPNDYGSKCVSIAAGCLLFACLETKDLNQKVCLKDTPMPLPTVWRIVFALEGERGSLGYLPGVCWQNQQIMIGIRYGMQYISHILYIEGFPSPQLLSIYDAPGLHSSCHDRLPSIMPLGHLSRLPWLEG